MSEPLVPEGGGNAETWMLVVQLQRIALELHRRRIQVIDRQAERLGTHDKEAYDRSTGRVEGLAEAEGYVMDVAEALGKPQLEHVSATSQLRATLNHLADPTASAAPPLSPRSARPWTEDQKTETGTRIVVKRACNGCGERLGDVTEAEMEAAVDGLPLPDVRWECERCGPELERQNGEPKVETDSAVVRLQTKLDQLANGTASPPPPGRGL